MRRFIVATNKQNLVIDNARVIEMDIADLSVIFNSDCLNVMSEEQYNRLLDLEYMYGIEIEFDNYLTGYRRLLKEVYALDPELICIFDVSIKRYISNAELTYFASNKLLPSKLFNIEIETVGKRCRYSTIGLKSIGLKEFKFESNLYLNEEDFQIFKGVVTNFIIGKSAGVYINLTKVEYSIIESEEYLVFDYNRPPKIFEFYIRDDIYLTNIHYDLIKYHWPTFLRLNETCGQLGRYLVNKSPVHDLANFEVAHVEEFTIVCDGINYNQDNLFYAYKYL